MYVLLFLFVHIACAFHKHAHKLKKVTQLNKFKLGNQGLKILKKQLEQQLERKKEAGKANYEVECKCNRMKKVARKIQIHCQYMKRC